MCLGVPGIIRERWQEADGQLLAHGDFGGETRVIRLNYLPDLQVGDWVITHAGFALTRLTPEDAAETIRTMREVGLLPEPEPAPAPAMPTVADFTSAAPLLAARPEWHGQTCVTCSDQGVVAEILAVPETLFDLARVRTADGEEEVDVMLVGPVSVGDLVLIHGGAALTTLDASDFAPEVAR